MRACGHLWTAWAGVCSAAGLTFRERHDTLPGPPVRVQIARPPADREVSPLLFFLLLRVKLGVWAGLSVSARDRAAGGPHDGLSVRWPVVVRARTEPEPPVVLV